MRRAALAVIVFALLVPVAPAHAATKSVGIGDFFFRAKALRVEPGDSVAWTNGGAVLHNVTSRSGAPRSFRSGDLDVGQGYSHVFAGAGTYDYVKRPAAGRYRVVVRATDLAGNKASARGSLTVD